MNDYDIPIKSSILSQRLKLFREEHIPKISRQLLAEQLGYSSGNTVLYWENGRSGIPTNDIDKICKLYDIRKEWLLGKDNFKTYNDIISNSRNILKKHTPTSKVQMPNGLILDDSLKISGWDCYTFPSIYEEYKENIIINALYMCGYKIDDIINRKQYADYMGETIKNAIELYMKTLNK